MRPRWLGGVALVLAGVAVWLLWPERNDGDDDAAAPPLRRGAVVTRARIAGADVGAEPARMSWMLEPGVAPRRVAGIVTNTGAPVVGARVELHSLRARALGEDPATVESGADGRFDFGPRPITTSMVWARGPEGREAKLLVNLRDPTETPPSNALVLELEECAHWFGGRVLEAGGGPIEGARIQTLERYDLDAWAVSDAAVSGADGSYVVCGEPGWFVQVAAEGYGTVRVSNQAQLHDVYLMPAAEIAGVVVDLEGRGVPDALVTLADAGRARAAWRTRAVSDENGRFVVRDLDPGRYVATVHAAAHYGEFEAESFQVGPGETRSGLVLVVKACPRALAGRVVDENDAAVTGAYVSVPLVDHAWTQDDGSFVLRCMSGDAADLEVRGYDLVEPARVPAGSEPISDVLVRAAVRGEVRGRVLSGGEPVAGTVVAVGQARLRPNPLSGESVRATSDADGRFVLRPPAGKQVITAFARDPDRVGGPVEVVIRSGASITRDIELRAGARIDGVVELADGTPVAGARVRLQRHTATAGTSDLIRETLPTAVSLDDGSFSLTGVPVGRFEVVAATTDAAAFERRIDIREDGSRVEVKLIAKPTRPDRSTPVRLVGRVEYADGEPAVFAFVQAWQAHTVTGADGAFDLRFVDEPRAGAVDLAVTGADGARWRGRVGIAGDPFVVTLERPGAIEGAVVGDADGWRIQARPPSGDYQTTIIAGAFRIDAIPPGEYELTARAPAPSPDMPAGRVVVEAGRTSRVTVELGPAPGRGSIVGTATSASGAPVEGASCGVELDHVLGMAATTGPDGRFERRGVPVGYTLVACYGGGAVGRAEVQVAADEVAQVVVTMSEP